MQIPHYNKQVLLGKTTSKQNKIWLATGWSHFHNWYIEWKWSGKELTSIMMFKFSPDEDWIPSESFEDDVLKHYKFAKEKKNDPVVKTTK